MSWEPGLLAPVEEGIFDERKHPRGPGGKFSRVAASALKPGDVIGFQDKAATVRRTVDKGGDKMELHLDTPQGRKTVPTRKLTRYTVAGGEGPSRAGIQRYSFAALGKDVKREAGLFGEQVRSDIRKRRRKGKLPRAAAPRGGPEGQ